MNQDPLLFHNDEKGRQAFTDLAQRVVAWIADYYRGIESRPVRSQVQPGEIYARFPDHTPEDPVSEDEVFRILDEVILPGMTHWQHPLFFGFFPGNTSFPSIAAEMLTAGMAAQCMLWESSPAAAELEQKCMDWCRDLLGLPGGWEGTIQDTASSATLTALLTAREWKSGFRISRRGYDGTVYRIYTSSQAHSSVEKAVRLAGIGTDNLIKVGVLSNLSMDIPRLEEAIQSDLRAGYTPLCVITTIGTTATGAVDPVEEVSRITSQYGLWHHVDAAYAGTALMLEEYAHLRKGLEGADSFVFNPHKWMFVQFDCSMYYVRDSELLTRTMSIAPSYLMTMYGDQVRDYRDWGIPLGRRFRALKLWMTLQLLGTKAIKSRLRHHIGMAQSIAIRLADDSRLEMVFPLALNVVNFRIKAVTDPDGLLTQRLSRMINDSGEAYLTYAIVEGQGLIRWVPGQTYTETRHVDSTWQLIQKLTDQILF